MIIAGIAHSSDWYLTIAEGIAGRKVNVASTGPRKVRTMALLLLLPMLLPILLLWLLPVLLLLLLLW